MYHSIICYYVIIQQDWNAGLKAVKDAMWVMPRSHHKSVLYFHTLPSLDLS